MAFVARSISTLEAHLTKAYIKNAHTSLFNFIELFYCNFFTKRHSQNGYFTVKIALNTAIILIWKQLVKKRFPVIAQLKSSFLCFISENFYFGKFKSIKSGEMVV